MKLLSITNGFVLSENAHENNYASAYLREGQANWSKAELLTRGHIVAVVGQPRRESFVGVQQPSQKVCVVNDPCVWHTHVGMSFARNALTHVVPVARIMARFASASRKSTRPGALNLRMSFWCVPPSTPFVPREHLYSVKPSGSVPLIE